MKKAILVLNWEKQFFPESIVKQHTLRKYILVQLHCPKNKYMTYSRNQRLTDISFLIQPMKQKMGLYI